MILSAAQLKFREAVGNFSRAHWAQEQQKEYECNAAIRYILLGRPAQLPDNFFDGVPKHRCTPFSGITEIADRARLVYDEGKLPVGQKSNKAPFIQPNQIGHQDGLHAS